MTANLDHVALNVAHMEETLEFFQTVFGMEVAKANGDAPMRKVWLRQGIQLKKPASRDGADRRFLIR